MEKEEFLADQISISSIWRGMMMVIVGSVVAALIGYAMLSYFLHHTLSGNKNDDQTMALFGALGGYIIFGAVACGSLAILVVIISPLLSKPIIDYMIDESGLAITNRPSGFLQGLHFTLRPGSRTAKLYAWEHIVAFSPTTNPAIARLVYHDPKMPAKDGASQSQLVFGAHKSLSGATFAERMNFHLEARKIAAISN
jgi:hypothetical protein